MDTPVTTSPTEQRTPFLLERIIDASARNAFLVIILTVFGIAGGIWALTKTPLDAIPDLSDVQVIVYTEWEGRSPDLVEDQITYPISTRFIAAPKVKFVRGESMFGRSFVYVIFQDGTDIYWARSRVIEYLNAVRGSLPEGVNPVIGPDATAGGRGYIKSIADIENVVLKVENGTPVYLKNVGAVHLGGEMRRGVAELDGRGEVVGGIVVMRYGENALAVIDGVKKKLADIQSSLP